MSDERWRVEVNRQTCVGSGLCVGIAPRRFRLDDNRSRPVSELTEPDEDMIDAAESCPTESILVRDDAGNLIAPKF